MKKFMPLLLGITLAALPLHISAETLNVTTPGTLRSLLVDMDNVPSSLKLTGTLNGEDLAYINAGAGSIASVTHLDLSEIALQADNKRYASYDLGMNAAGLGKLGVCFYLSNECRVDTTAGYENVFWNVQINYYGNNLAGLFAGNQSVHKVAFPTDLPTVAPYTFVGSKIEEATLPLNATSIEEGAFMATPNLQSLNIPESVQKIGEKAFRKSGIATLKLAAHCSSIGKSAFYDSNITSIEMPGVSVIEEFAFAQSNLSGNLDLSNITFLGDYTFEECKLTEVTFGPSLLTIPLRAFADNSGLAKVNFSEGLQSIGDGAFLYCSNSFSAEIPTSVTYIGGGVFPAAWVAKQPTVEDVVYINNIAYKFTGNESSVETVSFRDGTIAISENFSLYKSSVSTLIFPSSLKTIGEADIRFDPNTSVRGYVGSFSKCPNLSTIALPEGLEVIGDVAFRDCPNLKVNSWPTSLRMIGSGAFAGTGITSATLPAGLVFCGKDIFVECQRLSTINFFCRNLTTIPRTSPFFYAGNPGLEKVTIGNEVTSIPERFVANCGNLIRLNWPEPDSQSPLRTIGKEAFYNCGSLTTVRLNQGIEQIGTYAFRACSSLSSVDVPPSTTLIGEECFGSAEKLKYIYFHTETPPNMGAALCPKTTRVFVPEGGVNAYRSSALSSNTILPYDIQSFSLDKSEITLDAGETVQLVATIFPAEFSSLNVNWSSSNEEVATVDRLGKVTCVSNGQADIIAQVAFMPEYEAKCTINDMGGVEDVVQDAGLKADTLVKVYTIQGVLRADGIRISDVERLPRGLYIIISPEGKAQKVLI